MANKKEEQSSYDLWMEAFPLPEIQEDEEEPLDQLDNKAHEDDRVAGVKEQEESLVNKGVKGINDSGEKHESEVKMLDGNKQESEAKMLNGSKQDVDEVVTVALSQGQEYEELYQIKKEVQSLKDKPWRMVNAVEGFTLFSNTPSPAKEEAAAVKRSITSVVGHLITLALWTQTMVGLICTTMFVTSIFFIMSDFSDELSISTEADKQRRWAISLKLFSGFYVLFALILVIKTQRDRSRELTSELAPIKRTIQVGLNFYSTYTKYRMTTKLNVWHSNNEASSPVDFAMMLATNDLEFVQNTFLTLEPIKSIHDYEVTDNQIDYKVDNFHINLTMIADKEENIFYVREVVLEHGEERNSSEFLTRQKIYQLEHLPESHQLKVTLYSVDSEMVG